MADKITQKNELSLVAKFVDNDDRTITVDNPKANLTATDIKAFETVCKTTNAIIGDKGSADFYEFTKAKTKKSKKTELDLSL